MRGKEVAAIAAVTAVLGGGAYIAGKASENPEPLKVPGPVVTIPGPEVTIPSPFIPDGWQEVPDGYTVTPIESTTPPTNPDPTETPSADVEMDAQAFLDAWPANPREAAQKWGGHANAWELDQRELTTANSNVGDYGLDSFTMNEWVYTNPNLPEGWKWVTENDPMAALRLFVVNPNPEWARNMMPAWIDEQTGNVTGWHFSEDFHGGDVTVQVPAGAVLEGYSANESLRPQDDRAYIVYGGDEGVVVQLIGVQGFTVWGGNIRVEPNSLALRMDSYEGGPDHPHYFDRTTDQRLGPDPVNFPPAYLAPESA